MRSSSDDMDISVKNANYERVLVVMEKCLKNVRNMDGNLCTCSRCKSEIIAAALNLLPPHYHVMPYEGRRERGSPWIMVEAAVYEAIDRVMEHPHRQSGASCSADT